MYSILKILLGLKLTFLLIILGAGGSYVLERSALMRWTDEPNPSMFIQTAADELAEIVIPEPGSIEKLKKIDPVDIHKSIEPGQSSSRVYSLSDLRLHIEL